MTADHRGSPSVNGDGEARRLDGARRDLGLSVEDLWVLYIGLGGRWPLTELAAYLAGTVEPGRNEHRRSEHEVVAQAIDERIMDD